MYSSSLFLLSQDSTSLSFPEWFVQFSLLFFARKHIFFFDFAMGEEETKYKNKDMMWKHCGHSPNHAGATQSLHFLSLLLLQSVSLDCWCLPQLSWDGSGVTLWTRCQLITGPLRHKKTSVFTSTDSPKTCTWQLNCEREQEYQEYTLHRGPQVGESNLQPFCCACTPRAIDITVTSMSTEHRSRPKWDLANNRGKEKKHVVLPPSWLLKAGVKPYGPTLSHPNSLLIQKALYSHRTHWHSELQAEQRYSWEHKCKMEGWPFLPVSIKLYNSSL